jgi:hypothetical protein
MEDPVIPNFLKMRKARGKERRPPFRRATEAIRFSGEMKFVDGEYQFKKDRFSRNSGSGGAVPENAAIFLKPVAESIRGSPEMKRVDTTSKEGPSTLGTAKTISSHILEEDPCRTSQQAVILSLQQLHWGRKSFLTSGMFGASPFDNDLIQQFVSVLAAEGVNPAPKRNRVSIIRKAMAVGFLAFIFAQGNRLGMNRYHKKISEPTKILIRLVSTDNTNEISFSYFSTP